MTTAVVVGLFYGLKSTPQTVDIVAYTEAPVTAHTEETRPVKRYVPNEIQKAQDNLNAPLYPKRGSLTPDEPLIEYTSEISVYSEETEEEIKYSVYDVFCDELDLIPDSHLTYLYDRGWSFDLTEEDFGAEYGYEYSICGLTVYSEHTIYIRATEWGVRRSVIHEAGHALDYELGWPSETEEFLDIFNREADAFSDCTSIGDGHETEDVNEYWASVYQNIIINYDETVLSVPETVSFILDRVSACE